MISESVIRYKLSKVLKLCQTRITCESIEPQDNYFIVKLYGGDNGWGRFTNYLKDVKLITDQFDDIWLIDWVNDAPDDVWVLRLGIQNTKPCDLTEQW